MASLRKKEPEIVSKGKEFFWTGHPFVDAGLVAILSVTNKEKPEDLTEEDIFKAVDFVSKLYAKDYWSTSVIHGQIFPNSGVLMANPSMKKNRSPDKIAENLRKLYDEIPEANGSGNICMACGRRERLEKLDLIGKSSQIVGRHVVPLVGTGDMLNFFHSGSRKGFAVCAACLFLIQFMPVASYKLGRILTIHAYPPKYSLLLAEDAVEHARRSSVISDGRGFRRAESFLFHKVADISSGLKERWSGVSVTAYHFNNSNRGQDMNITYFPSHVLEFIAYAESVDSAGWRSIVRRGWGNQKSDFEELEKSTRKNEVYRRLLNGESILRYFYDAANKKVSTSWRLLEYYAREELKMDEKVLGFIKEVSDRIIETIGKEEDNRLRRTVRELEQADRLYRFEGFFIRVEKMRQKLEIPNALLTFDEFALLLTGYGEDINVSWRVVRDLILFRIYERYHDRLMKVVSGGEGGAEEEEEREGGKEE